MLGNPSRECIGDISELGSLMGTEDVIPVWEMDWSDNWPVPLEAWQYEESENGYDERSPRTTQGN